MAERLAQKVTLTHPCPKCQQNGWWTHWENAGATWYSCSFKIGGEFCNGKPPKDAAPPSMVAPTPEGVVPSQAPTPSGGQGYGDLFEKAQDCFAELSSIFGEIAHRMNGGS